MKKNWTAIYVYIFFFFFMFAPIFAITLEEMGNPFDYARITDIEYKAVLVEEVDSEGKVIITERITFDIHAFSKNNLFWELWRELPVDSIDGLANSYKVNSVKQIFDDGSYDIYEESYMLYWDDYDYIDPDYGPGKWYYDEYDECVLFYIDGVYRDELVFEIEYEMTNTVFKYNDSSELYLTMYSGNTIKYLDSYKGEILIANKDMPDKGNYEVYTYGTSNNSFNYSESKTSNPGYHTFYFELDKDDLKFDNFNNFLEFTLISYGDDRHIFSEHANLNYYSYDNCLWELRQEYTDYINDCNYYKTNKLLTFLGCMGIALFVIWHSYNTDKRIRKRYMFFKASTPITNSNYIPSMLDPIFAATLVFSKEKKQKEVEDGFSAIMLSLVRKGYIELVKINESIDWMVSNINIVIKHETKKFNAPSSIMPPGQLSTGSSTNNSNTDIYGNNIINNYSTFNKHNTFANFSFHVKNSVSNNTYNPYQSMANEYQAYNNVTPTTDQYTFSYTSDPTKTQDDYNPLEDSKLLEPLTLTEEHYFNLIIRHSYGMGYISFINFQTRIYNDYDNTDKFVRNMEEAITNIGISDGYFQKTNFKQPMTSIRSLGTFYIILAIFLLTIVNLISSATPTGYAYGGYTILAIVLIICGIYIKKNSHHYVLLTQFGEDEYARWRSLYNFLNSDEVMKASNLPSVEVCEQYLIYATAFGIPDKLVSALNLKFPDVVQNSKLLNNRYYRSRSFHHYSRTIRSTTRHASSISRSGGYGGGGRGGGGGGGGH